MINVTETYLPDFDTYSKFLKSLWLSGQITNRGPQVERLENKIQSCLKSNVRPLAVANGTIAIQIAIKVLKLKGEIITTPFSYIATASSIIWENCQPIFVDIHPTDLNINPELIHSKITEKTCGILVTHVFGNPCDVEAIEEISKSHNLPIIYDAAHCFGVEYKGKSLFDYGDISTCSFHATKIFHTVEGGGIFTNNHQYTKDVFLAHNFGHDGPGIISSVGVNGKLSEVHASMGLSIIEDIPQLIKKKKQIHNWYLDNLSMKNYQSITLKPETEWNYSYFPIIFSNKDYLTRVMSNLSNNNINARRYFFPSLNTLDFVPHQSCPISESIAERILCLPVGHTLTENDIVFIAKIVNEL